MQKKQIKQNSIIIKISFIAFFIMASFGILRIYYPTIPFIFNISDLLWVFLLTLLLATVPIKNPLLKLFVITLPYLGVMLDELMQKNFSLYARPSNHFLSLFSSGTYDPLDLAAYTIGFLLAIITLIVIKSFIK